MPRKKYEEQGHNQGLFLMDQDQDLSVKDKDKDLSSKDQDQDFKFVLKDSLKTRTRTTTLLKLKEMWPVDLENSAVTSSQLNYFHHCLCLLGKRFYFSR